MAAGRTPGRCRRGICWSLSSISTTAAAPSTGIATAAASTAIAIRFSRLRRRSIRTELTITFRNVRRLGLGLAQSPLLPPLPQVGSLRHRQIRRIALRCIAGYSLSVGEKKVRERLNIELPIKEKYTAQRRYFARVQ